MFEGFKQRSYELERLDTGDYTAAEYALWQREIRFINHIFGEVRALRQSLFAEIDESDKQSFSVLDVGAGAGVLLRELNKWAGSREAFLVGAEIDPNAAKAVRCQSIDSVACNGLYLPFADDSFDYAICSLFLHHLGDTDAVDLLSEMGRVARLRIFAIDLNRNPIAYFAYRAIGRVFLQEFTQEDGALSILRAFNARELRQLAVEAKLSEIRIEHSKVNRLILSGRLQKPARE